MNLQTDLRGVAKYTLMFIRKSKLQKSFECFWSDKLGALRMCENLIKINVNEIHRKKKKKRIHYLCVS